MIEDSAKLFRFFLGISWRTMRRSLILSRPFPCRWSTLLFFSVGALILRSCVRSFRTKGLVLSMGSPRLVRRVNVSGHCPRMVRSLPSLAVPTVERSETNRSSSSLPIRLHISRDMTSCHTLPESIKATQMVRPTRPLRQGLQRDILRGFELCTW